MCFCNDGSNGYTDRMTFLQVILLGALQGITEFLPISSSGHLVFVEALFGIQTSAMDLFGFDVLLHTGSLIALLLYYARTWWQLFRREHRRLLMIFVGTVPGGMAGVFLSDFIGSTSHALLPTSIWLGVTGCILLRIDQWRVGSRNLGVIADGAGWRDAAIIGIAQAFALFPGLSRSGLTIGAGYFCGLNKRDAVDFSFLLAAPIIAGASIEVARLWWIGTVSLPPPSIGIVGVVVSFLTSIMAIHCMRWWVAKRSLMPFGMYLLILSGVGIVITLS